MIRQKTRELTVCGLFAALIALAAQLSIPLPGGVPMTAQTMVIALCGYVLGQKSGVLAVGSYLLLGAVGLPVYAGFRGGWQMLFGTTGGFLWGFLLLVFFCGAGKGKRWHLSLLSGFFGLICCHLCGIGWYALIAHQPFWQSAYVVSLPFLLKDFVSVCVAERMARLVLHRMPAFKV